MHPHLVEWFRGVHINPDAKLAEQRWQAAKKSTQKLTQNAATRLLRLFLYTSPTLDEVKWLTDLLLTHDTEFPAANNREEVRVMAGVIIATTFEQSSHLADAFALGVRAATFPLSRTIPAQPEILSEAAKYLHAESERMRPNNFQAGAENFEPSFSSSYKAMQDAEAAADEAKILAARSAYHKAISQAIVENGRGLRAEIRRLAEETAMLWWVMGEHSASLNCGVSTLSPVAYALIAAAEAGSRTHILPPPVSADPLLTRALKNCKGATKKAPLQEYIAATPEEWRAKQSSATDLTSSTSLVPVSTAILKCVESGDPEIAVKTMANLCPGVDANLSLNPAQASHQYYAELMFLRALSLLPKA